MFNIFCELKLCFLEGQLSLTIKKTYLPRLRPVTQVNVIAQKFEVDDSGRVVIEEDFLCVSL